MDFKKINERIIQKGMVEDLKLKINRLEEAAKRGFIKEFIPATIEYNIAREKVKNFIHMGNLLDCDKKVLEIFNYISSRNTDKYWTF